jgi:hypothetical protein
MSVVVQMVRGCLVMYLLFAWISVYAQTVNPKLWVPNGQVRAMVKSGATVYIGGDFSYVGPVTGPGVLLDPSSGNILPNSPFVSGPISNSGSTPEIFVSEPDFNGGWYIGGSFTHVNGIPRNNIAHILPNGMVNPIWNPNPNGAVRAIQLSFDRVFVGGDFTFIGGVTRNRLAALNIATGTAHPWNPNANGAVRAMLHFGQTLYVGGSFSMIGDSTRNRVAAFDTSSGVPLTFNPNVTGAAVNAIVMGPNGLFIAGDFTQVRGQPRFYVAALRGDGSPLSPLAAPNGPVHTLLIAGNALYLGGSFSTIEALQRFGVGAINPFVVGVLPWNPSTNRDGTAPGFVNALAISGRTIFVGGDFRRVAGQTRNNLAAVDTAGVGALSAWNPVAGGLVNSFSFDLASVALFTGGRFASVNGVLRNYLAALNDSLGVATNFNANIARLTPTGVRSLAISGATLYAGGDFDSVGGQFRKRLCAVNATTGALSAWNPFPPSSNYSGEGPHALAISRGRVYVGGSYELRGVTPQRFHLVSLDSTNGALLPWNPNMTLTGGSVFALSVAGSLAYVGGTFSTIGDSSRNRIAALDTGTAKATSWNPNASGPVHSIAVSGSAIYIGGFFTTVRGLARNSLAAIDPLSGVPMSFNSFATQQFVNSLALGGNNLYVGGIVETDSSLFVSVNRHTGAINNAWRPRLQGGGAANTRGEGVAALVMSDTTVFVGGDFGGGQNSLRPNTAAFGDASLVLPAFDVKPSAISFGNLRVGQQRADSVLVTNLGGSNLVISSVVSSNGSFTVSPPSDTIPRGESGTFRIVFAPNSSGAQNGLIEFTHNGPNSPNAVAVAGVGIAPVFAVSPGSLNFDNVVVNTNRRDSVTVRNNGTDTLRVTRAQVATSVFSVTPTSAVILPDSTRKFFVTFTPDSATTRRDTLTFTHDAVGSPSRVSLVGAGVAPAFFVQPTNLDFGAVRVNATARDSSILVTNRGSSTLTISNVDSSLPQYRVEPRTAVLAANASQRFVVSFTPTTAQVFSGNIVFVHNAVGSPTNVAVTGRGVVPLFSIDSVRVSFGSVVVNTTSLDSVLVTNNGGAPLAISSITSSDTQFAVTPRTSVVGVGQTQRFTVSFTPNSPGLKSSEIIFMHDAAGSPQTVTAQGTGVVSTFLLDSTTLSFGRVPIGTDRARNLVVTNGGASAIVISSVGAGNPQFTVSPPRDSIPAGQNRTFVVRFAPTTPTTTTSAVTFTHTAAGSPTSIPVSGTGLGALLSLSRQSIPFGAVRVGASKVDSTIVRNDGNDTLVINGSSLGNSRFSSQPATARLDPGASRTFAVTFSPTDTLSTLDTLRLTHNAPGNPTRIPLSGKGALPRLFLAPNLVSFGAVPLRNFVDRTARLANDGLIPLRIDSVRIRGSHASEFEVRGSSVPFPSILAPRDTQRVFLRFTPTTIEENKFAALIVSGDMPTSPDTILLTGSGRSALVQITLGGDSAVGGNITITAQGPQGFPVDSASLHFRVAGRRSYASVGLAGTGSVRSGTFPDSIVTPRGIEYYVRFVGAQGAITNPETDPVNNPAILRVQVPRLASPLRFGARAYRMISIPLDVSDTTLAGQLVDDYGPYNPLRWRLFRWEHDTNHEFDRINRSFKPGNAFWLITQSGTTFDARAAQSVVSGRDYQIPLDTGWNQIATPFAFRVAWENVSRVSQPYFFDGMEFVPRIPALDPWEGYFVHNDSSQAVTLRVRPIEAGVTVAKQPSSFFSTSAREYVLQLAATAGQLRDTYNFVGFLNRALAGSDSLDLREPPAIAQSIRLSIVEDGVPYGASFKPLNADGSVWRLQVSSPTPNQTLRVALNEQGSLPEGFRLYILDEDEFAPIPIEANSFAVQISDQRPRTLKLILGTEAFARNASAGIPLQPVAYSLAQNYPNPFNPTTTIRYALSKRSRVTLEIFNLLGENVRTLINSEQPTGFHSVVWDGTTDAGISAASGVFLYRLTAGEFRATKKLILLR